MTITALLTHSSPEIRKLAEKAKEYRDDFDTGKITQSEYDSLCRQLLALDGMEKAAMDAEAWREVQEAVAVLRVFLGVLL